MIRVNLLPQKQKKERGGGGEPSSQKWLLVVLGVLVLEIVALVIFHQSKLSELADQKDKNTQIQAETKKIRDLVKNHAEVKKELEVLRAREDAIAQLQSGRTGPTAMMLEVAKVLTPGKGPTIDKDHYEQQRKDNPLHVYKPGWDSRRVWLTTYNEQQRTVRIEGFARDSADVSELAMRFDISSYFYATQVLPGKKGKSTGDVEMVSFALETKVRY